MASAWHPAGIRRGVDAKWSIAAVRDFDGDGKADVLWRHMSGASAMLLMNGLSIAHD
jgi:FG-GAP repeat